MRNLRAAVGAGLLLALTAGPAGAAGDGELWGVIEAKTPGELCVYETTLTRGVPPEQRFKLEHVLAVATEDQGLPGEIFVWFEKKSALDKRSFLAGSWQPYALNSLPVPFRTADKLEALYKIEIEATPEEVAAVGGDGMIVIGYGVRREASWSMENGFYDMLEKRRMSGVWDAALNLAHSDFQYCMTVTRTSVYARRLVPIDSDHP